MSMNHFIPSTRSCCSLTLIIPNTYTVAASITVTVTVTITATATATGTGTITINIVVHDRDGARPSPCQ